MEFLVSNQIKGTSSDNDVENKKVEKKEDMGAVNLKPACSTDYKKSSMHNSNINLILALGMPEMIMNNH